ncbi:amidohydrolase-domain-containing protein [Amanita rubescens]|nr:amidohydrolase-domain-containing protein [Amanita rubescens]
MSAELLRATLAYPAIDNHAHPLLSNANSNALPFEETISEASSEALINDAPNTLACSRAAIQLKKLFGMRDNESWADVKAKRASMDYVELCRLCLQESNIHCILIDDGLAPKQELESLGWHDQFTKQRIRRIVRVETEAEAILRDLFASQAGTTVLPSNIAQGELFDRFTSAFQDHLRKLISEPNSRVVGFKSIICYRTGLDVSLSDAPETVIRVFRDVLFLHRRADSVRLQHKPLNDYILRLALEVCKETGKPIQFHTGLGDNDLSLKLASPALLQPLIKAYPQVKFVLLHASYPFTREAGYLTSVYSNVFLDVGEIFPMVSGRGQHDILSQALEISPVTKVMFSSDGHFWPESYYLAACTISKSWNDAVRRDHLMESEAVRFAKAILYGNANRIYGLGTP